MKPCSVLNKPKSAHMPTSDTPELSRRAAIPAHRQSRQQVKHQRSSWRDLVWNNTFVRRALLLIVLAMIWEGYARWLDNDLILPAFLDTLHALWNGFATGPLWPRTLNSLELLARGYLLGAALATVLTLFAVSSRIGNDLLALFTAMFNPLPAIALLPLALLWFGLGAKSLLFVLVHAVLWPVALSTFAGFQGVNQTLKLVGQSFGLTGWRYVSKILIPAAFPSILAGLKMAWAFAWRTLIAAELVFGVSSGSGGLGWFIYENRNLLQIPEVFAGLLTIITIGLLVEGLIFRTIERHTVQRWGMQRAP
jgi:NitT/TauT family transport system permease protein